MNTLHATGIVIDIQKQGLKNWYTVFFDLKAAFDSVPHGILLKQLKNIKLSSQNLNIIKLLFNSYCTSLDGSNAIKIRRGVPQGSIIAPFLFNIFLNPLLKEIEIAKWMEGNKHIMAYADDLLFIVQGKRNVKNLIQLAELWCHRNGMQLNKKKSAIFKIQKRSTTGLYETELVEGI